MIISRPAIALPLLLAIAACGGDADVAEGDNADAVAEVVDGTISDAMLPLDQTRSQAPRAAGEEDGEEGGDGDSAPSVANDSGEAEQTAPEAEPAPAEETSDDSESDE